MSILDDSLSSFESSTPQRLHGGKKFPKGKNLIVVAALAVFAVVGVAASVQLAQRSQEIRNQASVPDGQVLITHSISPEAPQPNEPVTITFKVNTQSVNISGIQLTFTISPSAGQSLSGAPTVSLLSSSGMNQIIAPVITPGANGSYELLIAVAPPVPNSFSSTTPVDFASVTFMPSSVGNINVTFSTEDSLAALHDVPTSGDTLMHIAPFQITVAEAPTSTVEPSVTVTSTITSSPTLTPSNTPTSSPTNSPTSTLSPTQSVTLSPTISLTTAPTSSVSVTLPTMGGTCNSIMMNYLSSGLPVTAPRRGDVVNFTCGAVNGATRYEFRLREPSGSFISLQPVAEGSRISQSYTITQAGAFRGQCRACSGETEESCQVWE